MEKFNRKDIDFYLHDGIKGLPKKYIVEAIFDKEMQSMWHPQKGDIIVGPTGNVFIISNKRHFYPSVGGDMYFFGGDLAASKGCTMDTPTCYTMNEDGKFIHDKREVSWHSSWHKFRFVPYPHETNRMSEKFKAKASEYLKQQEA